MQCKISLGGGSLAYGMGLHLCPTPLNLPSAHVLWAHVQWKTWDFCLKGVDNGFNGNCFVILLF